LLRKAFTSIAIDVLGAAGVYPTSMTNKRELEGLIDTLRPVSTDIELIRLGPLGDGGYLVPDDLQGIEACFSPGVSDISGFEIDCADLGMKVFMADASVEGPAISHQAFQFTKKHVGAVSDDFMTMDQWVASSSVGTDTDLLLKWTLRASSTRSF